MCDVTRFKEIISGVIDRCFASLSECELAGNHISNSWANVVMDSEVGIWGECHFGGPHFELTVKLLQVAEDNLIEF